METQDSPLPKRISELWAWVAELPNGTQSIPAAQAPNGLVLPLFGTNEQAMRDIAHIAQEVANQEEGSVVRLCRFDNLEVVDEITANTTASEG